MEDAIKLPPLTPRSTKRSPERRWAHEQRMTAKKIERGMSYGEKERITQMSRNTIRRRYGPNQALINRHTGEPHKHEREIARRLRQAGTRD